MSVEIIQERLATYSCRSTLEEEQADWYDFVWYTARRTSVNHEFLSAALDQQGPWKGRRPKTDDAWCVEQLRASIKDVDWGQTRRDVQRFVSLSELPSLELWTREFFEERASRLVERRT